MRTCGTFTSTTSTNGPHPVDVDVGIGSSYEDLFPAKLHYVLEQADKEEGLADVIAWQPHGRAFLVKDRRRFVQEFLPNWFRQRKWASFQRQLNHYNFQRMTTDRNAYYHPFFIKGERELCAHIRRSKCKGTGPRKPSKPKDQPNFYDETGSSRAHIEVLSRAVHHHRQQRTAAVLAAPTTTLEVDGARTTKLHESMPPEVNEPAVTDPVVAGSATLHLRGSFAAGAPLVRPSPLLRSVSELVPIPPPPPPFQGRDIAARETQQQQTPTGSVLAPYQLSVALSLLSDALLPWPSRTYSSPSSSTSLSMLPPTANVDVVGMVPTALYTPPRLGLGSQEAPAPATRVVSHDDGGRTSPSKSKAPPPGHERPKPPTHEPGGVGAALPNCT